MAQITKHSGGGGFFVVVDLFGFVLVLGFWVFFVFLVLFDLGFVGRELVSLVISVPVAVEDRSGRKKIVLLP